MFHILNSKNISKITEKPATEAYRWVLFLSLPLPLGLKACISAEGLTRVTGHSRAGDPSPPKEMASHVNEHKNIKTAFMFVQPFAHSYISQPFRDKTLCLGRNIYLTSLLSEISLVSLQGKVIEKMARYFSWERDEREKLAQMHSLNRFHH